MTAATQQQPPVIPPRPSRGQDREQAGVPKIPPRPIKLTNPDRYAPSPLNGSGPFLSKSPRAMISINDEPIDRPQSVEIPTVGEEGWEYARFTDEHISSSREPSTSPTQTRTIANDLKIHAPKPSLPALSAKQRVMTVTRTDSDKAASYGIGKPSSDSSLPPSSAPSLKKKASTTSQLSRSESVDSHDEHGIPEIGLQVPMYPNAGDVQAPSPAPGSPENLRSNHKRKTSSRGLPPGSYGLHGHGVVPQDKLDQKYYEKHPEALKAEHHPYQHDRPTDFSMSSDDLNKIVRDTGSRGAGLGSRGYTGTPSEQAGWLALDESASRPQSTKPDSSLNGSSAADDNVIHVDEPNRRRSVLFSDEATPAPIPEEEYEYDTPILAEDEVRKGTPSYDSQPAIEPVRERRGSAYEMDPPRSRPTSRPTSLYRVESNDLHSTPLEDVEEYEPLFPEDDQAENDKGEKKHLTPAQIKDIKQRFPSQDIWEDAPTSVHHTAMVSTPEVPAEDYQDNELRKPKEVPPRATETPAQAFARQQEELAEKEHTHPDSFLWRTQKPGGLAHLPHLAQEAGRPAAAPRFPSRDVWEDTPDSLRLETTVSTPQQDEASPVSPALAKRSIPERPQPKVKPVIPERPKPQVPARPAKTLSSSSKDSVEAPPAPKAKPAVPSRPAGNKIAALQAGFMSDLNKRLQIGPQAPKKEETKVDDVTEEKEKAPLVDARKGRARGPQRRAPAASSPGPGPAAAVAASSPKPKLSFATTVTIFTIDPDEGSVLVEEVGSEDKTPVEVPTTSAIEQEQEGPAVKPESEREIEEKGEMIEPAEKHDEKVEKTEEAEKVEEAQEEEEEEEEEEPKEAETKTQIRATNMAGETVQEATLKVDKDETKVEPIAVDASVVKD